jgi:hypothetical protein
VKRLINIILILSIASLGVVSVLAATNDKSQTTSETKSPPSPRNMMLELLKKRMEQSQGRDQITTEPEEDPNAVEAKELTPLEKKLGRLNRRSIKESREWTQNTTEDRTKLAQAVQQQITDELNFLREIALEEEAVNTTKAIELLLASRAKRFEKVLARMKSEQRNVMTPLNENGTRNRGEPRTRERRQPRQKQRTLGDKRVREKPSGTAPQGLESILNSQYNRQ